MTSSEQHYRKLERMYASAPTNEYYSPGLSIRRGEARIRIAVKPAFYHAAHAVHGSVYFKALDDAAYFATNSLVEDVLVLTASFNFYLVRPISSGSMQAEGRVVHASRRLYVAEAVLHDSKGRQLARGSGSFMCSEIPLSADLGYV